MTTYIIYKPFQMLSQFTRELPTHVTLADLDYNFPSDVYPVGRLDADSEGLLVLTNNKSLNAKLLQPQKKVPKTYWVQVEGAPDEDAIRHLCQGVAIKVKGSVYHTKEAKVHALKEAPRLPVRNPPIRYRKNDVTTWLSITIAEGKNRQVRKMCAAVGHGVLRLVRVQINGLTFNEGPLEGMVSGSVLAIDDSLLQL